MKQQQADLGKGGQTMTSGGCIMAQERGKVAKINRADTAFMTTVHPQHAWLSLMAQPFKLQFTQ